MLALTINVAFCNDDNSLSKKVQSKISDKITANAEFYQGEPGKANILILHGFLITHNFHTVTRLAESLHGLGFSVLTPTLSLGINKRKKMLACEAIHLHSAQDDILELDHWVKWLKEKSDEDIVLIGHSTGSLITTSYLSTRPFIGVKQAIFLSMPDFGPSHFSKETTEMAETAKKLIKDNNHSLFEFGLAYCQKYTSTPENFLSYYHLSKDNIFKNLKKISIDKTLILGSEDKRINQQWNHDLARLGINVIEIEGANHFFDYEYEFDLLDTVENILNR